MNDKVIRGAMLILSAAMMAAAIFVPDKPERVSCSEKPNTCEPVVIQTSRPYPTPDPASTWTRYPVPLEDDLQKYINDLADAQGIDPAIIYAVIDNESDFDADKLGDGGESYGLMQIYQSEHRERCLRLGAYNLYNPRDNVRVGIDYLAELIGWGNGLEYALSFYNGNGGALPWGYVDDVLEQAAVYAAAAETVEE